MVIENLWGPLSTDKEINTPLLILKEQAEILRKITGGQLMGIIQTYPFSSSKELLYARKSLEETEGANLWESTFYIAVPALENYRVAIMKMEYSLIDVYPVSLRNCLLSPMLVSGPSQCSSEEEFKKELSAIFQSSSVQKVISALLAQIALSDSDT